MGNLGSQERLAYTAVGDNINLGARLEARNKTYGTNVSLFSFIFVDVCVYFDLANILVSGEVYEQVKDQFLCRYLDVVVVCGKTTHTHIYELITYQKDATEKTNMYVSGRSS